MPRARSSFGGLILLVILLAWLTPLPLRSRLLEGAQFILLLDWIPNVLPYWHPRWIQKCDPLHLIQFWIGLMAIPPTIVFFTMRLNGKIAYDLRKFFPKDDQPTVAVDAAPPHQNEESPTRRPYHHQEEGAVDVEPDTPGELPIRRSTFVSATPESQQTTTGGTTPPQNAVSAWWSRFLSKRQRRGICGGKGCVDGMLKVMFFLNLLVAFFLVYWTVLVFLQALPDSGSLGPVARAFWNQAQVNWWHDAIPLVDLGLLLILVEGWRVRMGFWRIVFYLTIGCMAKGFGSIVAVPLFLLEHRSRQRSNDLSWWYVRLRLTRAQEELEQQKRVREEQQHVVSARANLLTPTVFEMIQGVSAVAHQKALDEMTKRPRAASFSHDLPAPALPREVHDELSRSSESSPNTIDYDAKNHHDHSHGNGVGSSASSSLHPSPLLVDVSNVSVASSGSSSGNNSASGSSQGSAYEDRDRERVRQSSAGSHGLETLKLSQYTTESPQLGAVSHHHQGQSHGSGSGPSRKTSVIQHGKDSGLPLPGRDLQHHQQLHREQEHYILAHAPSPEPRVASVNPRPSSGQAAVQQFSQSLAPLPTGSAAVALQLAHEPVDSRTLGVDMLTIRREVKQYCRTKQRAEEMILDLLSNPSPINTRALSRIHIYGLNLPWELVLTVFYFWTALHDTYVWMSWQTQHEENACWITTHQEEAFTHPASFMFAMICFMLFLPWMIFEVSWVHVFLNRADVHIRNMKKQPIFATLVAMAIVYWNNINVAIVLAFVLAFRELNLSFGSRIGKVLNEVKNSSGGITLSDPLPNGVQSVWWSSKHPLEYVLEQEKLELGLAQDAEEDLSIFLGVGVEEGANGLSNNNDNGVDLSFHSNSDVSEDDEHDSLVDGQDQPYDTADHQQQEGHTSYRHHQNITAADQSEEEGVYNNGHEQQQQYHLQVPQPNQAPSRSPSLTDRRSKSGKLEISLQHPQMHSSARGSSGPGVGKLLSSRMEGNSPGAAALHGPGSRSGVPGVGRPRSHGVTPGGSQRDSPPTGSPMERDGYHEDEDYEHDGANAMEEQKHSQYAAVQAQQLAHQQQVLIAQQIHQQQQLHNILHHVPRSPPFVSHLPPALGLNGSMNGQQYQPNVLHQGSPGVVSFGMRSRQRPRPRETRGLPAHARAYTDGDPSPRSAGAESSDGGGSAPNGADWPSQPRSAGGPRGIAPALIQHHAQTQGRGSLSSQPRNSLNVNPPFGVSHSSSDSDLRGLSSPTGSLTDSIEHVDEESYSSSGGGVGEGRRGGSHHSRFPHGQHHSLDNDAEAFYASSTDESIPDTPIPNAPSNVHSPTPANGQMNMQGAPGKDSPSSFLDADGSHMPLIKSLVHAWAWLVLRVLRLAWTEVSGGVTGFFGSIGGWFRARARRFRKAYSWGGVAVPLHENESLNTWVCLIGSMLLYWSTLYLLVNVVLYHINGNHDLPLRWVVENVFVLVAIWLVRRDVKREGLFLAHVKSEKDLQQEADEAFDQAQQQSEAIIAAGGQQPLPFSPLNRARQTPRDSRSNRNSDGPGAAPKIQIEGHTYGSRPMNGTGGTNDDQDQLLSFLALSPREGSTIKGSSRRGDAPAPSFPTRSQAEIAASWARSRLPFSTFLRHPLWALAYLVLHSIAYMTVCPRIDHEQPGMNSSFFHLRIALANLFWHWQVHSGVAGGLAFVSLITLFAIQFGWTANWCKLDVVTAKEARRMRGRHIAALKEVEQRRKRQQQALVAEGVSPAVAALPLVAPTKSSSRALPWSRFFLFLVPLLLAFLFVWPDVTTPCHTPLGTEASSLTDHQLRQHKRGTEATILDRVGLGRSDNDTSSLSLLKDPLGPSQPLPALRAAHSKQHGCVKAVFSTPHFIPEKFKHGLFAEGIIPGITMPGQSSGAGFEEQAAAYANSDKSTTPAKSWHAFVRFSSGQAAKSDGRGNWVLQPDSVSDVRGMAVKVVLHPSTPQRMNMSLSPEQREQHQTDVNTQDFVSITSESFFARDAFHLAGLTSAASNANPVSATWKWLKPREWGSWNEPGGWSETFAKLGVGLKALLKIAGMNADGGRVNNPLKATYFSATPYRLGPEPEEAKSFLLNDALAVKFRWTPCSHTLEEHEHTVLPAKTVANRFIGAIIRLVNNILHVLSGGYIPESLFPYPGSSQVSPQAVEKDIRKGHGHSFLRMNMQSSLHPDSTTTTDSSDSLIGACFDLQIQEQLDACVNPIEDASKVWSQSVWIPVARLEIPKQFFLHDAALNVCENLSFNPWHSLAAHRPLGDINLVRRDAYLQSSALRRKLNNDHTPLGPIFTGDELPVLLATPNITSAVQHASLVSLSTSSMSGGWDSAAAARAHAEHSQAALASRVLYGNPATYEYLPYPHPWAALPPMIRNLPLNESFSLHSETLIAYNTLHSLFSQTPAQPRQRADMSKVQHFEQLSLGRKDEAVLATNHLVSGRMRRPSHVDEEIWTQDEFFGMQFIRGLNPMKIVRVTPNTPMTPRLRPLDATHKRQVKEALQGQDASSLEELSDQQRLLFADYPEILNLTTVKDTVLYSPVAVFYLTARKKELLPLLIQLENYIPCFSSSSSGSSTRSSHSQTRHGIAASLVDDDLCVPYLPALFFPAAWVAGLPGATVEHPHVPTNTPEAIAWLFAKMHVASADAQSHQLISHLLETHLVLETTIIGTFRALSEKHYLHRLLRPHFKGTLAINDFGRMTLVSFLEPFVDSFQSIGVVGAHQMMTRRYASEDYIYMEPLPAQIRRRGFTAAEAPATSFDSQTADDLPGFLYRDYGLPLYYLFREYVLEVLATEPMFAESESLESKKRAMDADPQLQSWFHELFVRAELPLRGRADPRESFNDFVDLLTQILFQATAQHAAVNFPQYDFLSFSPVRPLSLTRPMPGNLTMLDEKYILDSLVSASGLEILHTTYDILSTCCVNTLMLDESESTGMLETATTVEPTFPELWDHLREKMRSLQKKEQKHNRKNKWNYPYLYPSRIPYSTAI